MIREATPDDIPMLLAMGRAFADEAGVTARVGWDDGRAEALLTNLIANENGILLVGKNSMIGGVVYEHPFSGVRVFQEMFWRSYGRDGVRLLKAAETRARELGATRSMMIGMDDMPDIGRLYARLGYDPAERCFMKVL